MAQSSDFNARIKIFNELLLEEELKLKGTSLEQKSYKEDEIGPKKQSRKRNAESNDRSAERLIGKESIFKKPELPIERCLKPGKKPDFLINPHKWTRYSLEDAETSDATNVSAALTCLSDIERIKGNTDTYEIQNPKETKQNSDRLPVDVNNRLEQNQLKRYNENEEVDKPYYKVIKYDMLDNENNEEADKPHFKGCKYVMPEYVVGQPTKKRIGYEKSVRGKIPEHVVRPSPTANRFLKLKSAREEKELKLSHLWEDEDDINIKDKEKINIKEG